MNSIKKEIRSLTTFLRKPFSDRLNRSTSEKLKKFAFAFLVNIIMICIVLYTFQVFDLSNITNNHKIYALISKFPVWILGTLIIIIIPVIEEIVFRFHLKYRAWINNILYPLLISAFFYLLFNYLHLEIHFLYIYGVFGILAFIFRKRTENYYNHLYTRRFPIIFYATALIFALVHVSNYPLSKKLIFVVPLLVLPQLITGTLIGYIRIKNGFL